MSNGKYSNRKSGKAIVALVALVMILAIGIGGTLAYLTNKTNQVTNTFVMGDIGTLTLTEPDEDTNTNENGDYVIVPGATITKDPVVKYTPVDEDEEVVPVPVYVFVEISTGTATNNWHVENNVYSISLALDEDGNKVATGGTMTELMRWEVNTADGAWTAVNGVSGVYYKALNAGDTLGVNGLAVIKDNQITVSDKITKSTIGDVAGAAQDISFTAYAIQQATFETDPAAAWTAVKNG